jgi:Gas vesicle protein
MTMANVTRPGAEAAQVYGSGLGGGRDPANLGDILERVLDKGLVIAGDIKVNLLDIELLTIKLRLVIASLDTAREVGIDWWERDPWLSASAFDRAADDRGLEEENRRLRERVKALESGESRETSRTSRETARETPRTSRETARTSREPRGRAR